MSAAQSEAAAVRRGAGLFHLLDRGLIAVEGGDRTRWLNGMLSNDVAVLAHDADPSGCYAALLTRQGRIVADLHVLARSDAFWLELAAEAVPPVAARLDKFIIADDVSLVDRSRELARLALEGPRAEIILNRALGAALDLPDHACRSVQLAGAEVLIAAYGWSGTSAYQFLVPADRAPEVAAILSAAGSAVGLVEAGDEALEILRIEAGTPRFGRELDEAVLPAEARLVGSAVSVSKGCYTGQEIVARMASRGRVSHLLVGFQFGEGPAPQAGQEVFHGDAQIGEVTSVCHSPQVGIIGLGYVRVPHDAPGTELRVAGRPAVVTRLPFIPGEAPGR